MSGHGFGCGRGLLQHRDQRWPRSPKKTLRPPAPGASARAGGKSKSIEMRQPPKIEEFLVEQNRPKATTSQSSYANIVKNEPDCAPHPSGDCSVVRNPPQLPSCNEQATVERDVRVVVENHVKSEEPVSSTSPLFVVPNAPKASSWMEQSSMTDSEIMESLEKERLRFPSFETLCSPGASADTARVSPTVFVTPPAVPSRAVVKSPSVSSMSCDNTPSNCDSPSDFSDSHGSYDFCCEDPDPEGNWRARDRQAPFVYNRPKMRASLPTSAQEGVTPCVNFRTTEMMMERFANVAPFIDSHCHIDFLLDYTREQRWQDVLDRHFHHRPRNFRGFIQVFCSHRRFRLDDPVLAMLRDRPDVWFAFGAHPKRLNDWSPRVLQAMRLCLTQVPNVVALGEVGLDYSGEFYRKANLQKEALRQQLELAVELKLPIVLHCREGHYSLGMDADQDLMDILREYVPRNHRMHLHCFTRDWQRGSRWLATFPHLMLGLTPLVTQRGTQRGTQALEVIRNIPLDRVLIETDTPYFLPEEIDRRELTQSLPWFAITVAEQIATLRQMPLDVVLGFILSNTHRMYGLNSAQRLRGRNVPALDFNL